MRGPRAFGTCSWLHKSEPWNLLLARLGSGPSQTPEGDHIGGHIGIVLGLWGILGLYRDNGKENGSYYNMIILAHSWKLSRVLDGTKLGASP